MILYFTDTGKPYRVSAAGGDCSPVTLGEENLRGSLPEFMPDGNRFAFTGASAVNSTTRGVYLGSLQGAKPRRILNDYSSVLYSPPLAGAGSAHLLFLRGSVLMAQPFSPDKLEPVGEPFPVAAQVSRAFSPDQMAASVAADGTLVYLTSLSRRMQLAWLDRSGKEVGKLGRRGERVGVSLSPDGSIVAIQERTQTQPLGGLRLIDIFAEHRHAVYPGGQSRLRTRVVAR